MGRTLRQAQCSAVVFASFGFLANFVSEDKLAAPKHPRFIPETVEAT
jgi:hypothetical protein